MAKVVGAEKGIPCRNAPYPEDNKTFQKLHSTATVLANSLSWEKGGTVRHCRKVLVGNNVSLQQMKTIMYAAVGLFAFLLLWILGEFFVWMFFERAFYIFQTMASSVEEERFLKLIGRNVFWRWRNFL